MKNLLGSWLDRLGISSEKRLSDFHMLLNHSTYNFLKEYTFPEEIFPYEEAITGHNINSIFKLKSRSIEKFSRVGYEHYTGSDLLLILRGTGSDGERKEFLVTYQAKNPKWSKGKYKLELDSNPKSPYFLRDLSLKLKELDSYINLNNYVKSLVRNGVIVGEIYQHEAQYNFSKIIGACPLYLLYTYRHGVSENWKKATTFFFTDMLINKMKSESQSNKVHDAFRKVWHHENLKDLIFFAPKTFSDIVSLEDRGFFGFNSKIETSHERIKSIFDKLDSTLEFENNPFPKLSSEKDKNYHFEATDRNLDQVLEDNDGHDRREYYVGKDSKHWKFSLRKELDENYFIRFPDQIMVLDFDK